MNLYKILTIFFLLFGGITIEAQILKSADKLLRGNAGLTEKDASNGIKEALIKGTGIAVNLVTKTDGYFGNPEIKIPFPEEVKTVESKLRELGFGEKVDEFIVTMNRAAEDAAKEAKPIFVSAIKQMTVRDAINIVKGENNAATMYLKNTTSAELISKFQPHIKTSLDKVQATKYWDEIITTYNKIPLLDDLNPDLTAYVTSKAIDGLFVMVAKEELEIRKNPMARTTALLKKVFGN